MKALNFRQIHFVILVMTGLLLCPWQRALAQSTRQNLLVNGDFSKGTQGWELSAWNKRGEASVDAAENYQGKPAVKVFNSGVDDTQFNQKVTLKPHTRYRFSGMIKTKDVVPANKTSKGGAALCVQGAEKSKSLSHSSPWTRITLEIDSGPRTDVLLGPRLGHNSDGMAGTAWFADLSLVELGPGKK